MFTRQAIYNNELKTIAYQLILPELEIPAMEPLQLVSITANQPVFVPFQAHCHDKIVVDDVQAQQLYWSFNPGDDASLLREQMEAVKGEGSFTVLTDIDQLPTEQMETLLPLVDIVLLDLLKYEDKDLEHTCAELQNYKNDILISNIVSYQALQQCQEMGAQFFQGSFLCHPDYQAKTSGASNGFLSMVLLEKLQDPDISITDVEHALGQDPRLAYKLLRTVNSAAFGLKREISSLREAVVLIGINQLRRWTSLIALSNVEGKPQELMTIALQRGRMCELLAEEQGFADASSFFTTGLFSTLDALFDRPMEDLLEELSLSDEIKDALLNNSGQHGNVLSKVKNFEDASWNQQESVNEDDLKLSAVYVEALEWTDQFTSVIED